MTTTQQLHDMRGAVSHAMNVAHSSQLERRDFDERYTTAVDDSERVKLCRDWLRAYDRMQRVERYV